MTKRADIDWAGIEKEYRAGTRPLKAIAADYGVSDAGIIRHAKSEGWERDLGERIRVKVEKKVSARMAKVSARHANTNSLTESQVVEANAECIAAVVLRERQDIADAMAVVQSLFAELRAVVGNAPELERLGEILTSAESGGLDKLHDAYRAVISLPGRVKALKDLAEALRVLIELERKVLRLDTQQKDPAPPNQPGSTNVLAVIGAEGIPGLRSLVADLQAGYGRVVSTQGAGAA